MAARGRDGRRVREDKQKEGKEGEAVGEMSRHRAQEPGQY